MTPVRKGLILAAIQVALVASLGARLLYDRASRPRAWVQTAPIDPDLPIRGRYVSLRLRVPGRGAFLTEKNTNWTWVRLRGEDGNLFAVSDGPGPAYRGSLFVIQGEPMINLWEPVAFFIPEHAKDPSQRPPGEELWVEVTLPKKGPPRPIRLGVKRAGELTPLDLR